METLKTQLWRLLPALLLASVIAVAFAGFFIWLLDRQLLASGSSLFWLILFGACCALVGAMLLGERPQAALQRVAFEQNQQRADKQRAVYAAMAQAAEKAMADLANVYSNTMEDRLRIRAVYHKDTFSAVLGALSSIPTHELSSAEAAIALAGLKQNMRDAQYMIDLYIPWQDPVYGGAPSRQLTQIDLRSCKSFAEIHCRQLMQALVART